MSSHAPGRRRSNKRGIVAIATQLSATRRRRGVDQRGFPGVGSNQAALADNRGAACENDRMTKTELHELVEGLPDDSLDGAAVLLRSLTERRIEPDQAWFWTLDWLSGELEADREARTDPGVIYEDAETFKAALHATRSE
jgi:hypothetical protein